MPKDVTTIGKTMNTDKQNKEFEGKIAKKLTEYHQKRDTQKKQLKEQQRKPKQ